MRISHFTKSVLTLGAGVLMATSPALSMDLEKYQWENRLLLVFSPSSSDAEFVTFNRQMNETSAGVAERDLVVFRVFEVEDSRVADRPLSAADAEELRRRFRVASGRFRVVLIGKDGGVKMTRNGETELQEIFNRIDAMPMRRREMREKG